MTGQATYGIDIKKFGEVQCPGRKAMQFVLRINTVGVFSLAEFLNKLNVTLWASNLDVVHFKHSSSPVGSSVPDQLV